MFSNTIGDYIAISQKLQLMFELDKSPVSIKLYEYTDEISEELPKIQKKARHCEMVYEAAKNKSKFYATLDENSCTKGATVLGLMDSTLMNTIPKIDPIIEAVGYAPLEESPFVPDSVILYCNPVQIMKIARLLLQTTEKRINSDFGGVSSLCADVVAKPYLTNQSNVSFGCNGSREYTDIDDNELVMGLTMEDILSIVNY